MKRIHKNSLFICTIEKAHALFNSLVVENRLDEIGLVVVDEVHMIGEDLRGANLESFLAKLKYLNRIRSSNIQIISMSATVGNLKELSLFLESELYTDSWRPVQLEEFIKVGLPCLVTGSGNKMYKSRVTWSGYREWKQDLQR